MDIPTVPGAVYSVVAPTACTITDTATGRVLETTEPNKQKDFRAFGSRTTLSDPNAIYVAASTFSSAPTIGFGAGGGATITFDTVPTQNSTNAVTSGGLYNMLSTDNLKLGFGAYIQGSFATAIGGRSESKGTNSSAFGNSAKTDQTYATALGAAARAKGKNTTVVGANITAADDSVVCLGSLSFGDGLTKISQTNLYLISAGSPLANTYENGEACLGYLVKDMSGNVLACGTRPLSELLTNNTAFAPASMDLDADPPTPFLPIGATAPIELPELEEYV